MIAKKLLEVKKPSCRKGKQFLTQFKKKKNTSKSKGKKRQSKTKCLEEICLKHKISNNFLLGTRNQPVSETSRGIRTAPWETMHRKKLNYLLLGCS